MLCDKRQTQRKRVGYKFSTALLFITKYPVSSSETPKGRAFKNIQMIPGTREMEEECNRNVLSLSAIYEKSFTLR